MHKRIRVVGATLLLCGMLAGCGKVDGTQPAITVNGESVNLGTAAYSLRYQQAETTYSMQMWGLVSEGTEFWGQEYEAEEDGTTKTYGDSMKASIQESLVDALVMRQHAADYGVEMPENVLEAAKNAAHETFVKNEATLTANGISEADILEMLTLSSYASLLYEPMTADVDTEVSEEDAKQTTLCYAGLSSTIEETSEEEGEEAAEETADPQALMETYLQKLKEAEDPAAVDMDALATEINEDIMIFTNSFGKQENYLPEEVIEAATDLKDGEVYDGVIESSDGNLYVVRMEAVYDEEATELQKESIITNRKQEAYSALLDSWREEAEISTGAAWDALTVSDDEIWTIKTAS